MVPSGKIGGADIAVFSVCSLLPLVIGALVLKYGGSQSSTREYFLGGQKQGVLPVVVSLVVSFQSGVLVLGVPAEVYLYGTMYGIRLFSMLVLIPVFVNIFAPLFYSLKLTSRNQYFGGRFPSNKVRYLMVCCAVLTNMFYSGIVLLGPAIVIQSMVGIPDWIVIIGMSVAAMAYTSLGGIKVVLWTDVFQCVVMIAGMVALVIKCTIDAGGPANVIDIASKYKRLELFDFNLDPTVRHTFWTLNIGEIFATLPMLLTQQTVQRVNSMPSLSRAKFVSLIFLPCFYVPIYLAMACGVVVFAYYQTLGCDPIAAGIIMNPNEILVKALHDVFRVVPGLTGLFLAALLSASLSSVSSSLNGLAAIACEDFLKLKWKNMSDKRATRWSKLSVLAMGVASTVMALILRFAKGNLAQMCASIMGSLAGPSGGIFLLSIFYKKTTTPGLFVGAAFGFLVSLWLMVGYNFSPTLPQTPWLPLGMTNHCFEHAMNNSLTFSNGTRDFELSNTTVSLSGSSDNVARGLDMLYSVSYMYFSVITTLLTITVGGIVSRISYSMSGAFEPPAEYMMSFREVFACPAKLYCRNKENVTLPAEEVELQTDTFVDT